MPTKVWKSLPEPPAGFAESVGKPSFEAQLLYNRGVRTPMDAGLFLDADTRLTSDPLLLPDMDKAVARLLRAMEAGETIGVFGDFDTDGVSGTALLVMALGELGARVVPYLPSRMDEGHGLNPDAVSALVAQGVSVLVTVDCGVSSVAEVELASSLGMDTVITDHHSPHALLPQATAVVNPHRRDSTYPFGELTGAGLSFKLVEAIWAAKERGRPDHLIEIAALGTVADVAPLKGENRFIVRRGLEFMNKTQHPGLLALIARAGLERGALDTDSLSFWLIPRINAAGRLGDASDSLKLLMAADAATAEPLAEALEQVNLERRQLSEAGVAQAHEQVEAMGPLPPIIFVEHQEWQPGIIGLIAGSLAEHYYRPVIATLAGEQECRASARSIREFNIIEAFNESKDLFSRFGGHPRAAGFTLASRHMPELRSRLTAAAGEALDGANLTPTIEIDCEISPTLLNEERLRFLRALGPTGEGNPAPVFLTRDARVMEARQVGVGGAHLRMRIGHSGRTWKGIAFRQGDRDVAAGDLVDLVYTARRKVWRGVPEVELSVLDFHQVE